MKRTAMMVLAILMLLLLLLSSASADDSNTLTIMNVPEDGRYYTAVRLFRQKYLSTEIELVYINDSREISTYMMAGETDLLYGSMHAYRMGLEEYYKSGVIVDLMQFPEIAQYKDLYLDDMLIPVYHDDRLLGIPDGYSPHFWRVNDELLKKIGLKLPDTGWTWQDFIRMGEQVKAYNEENGTHYYLLAENARWRPYIMDQLTSNAHNVSDGTANYLNDTYEAALEGWLMLMQDGLFQQKSYMSTQNDDGMSVFQHIYIMTYNGLGNKTYVVPPVFDEDTLHPLDTYALVLNANAGNKEAAVYFLSCYFSPEAVTSQPYTSNGPMLKDEPRTFHEGYGNRAPSEKNAQLWLDMLAISTQDLSIGEVQARQRNDLYPMLFDGKITVRQFLEFSQEKANMMLGE